jgi:pentatricopeptide repeat protein
MQREFQSCGPAALRMLTRTYSVLLRLCAKRMLPDQATALLHRMERAHLPVDADAYHYALDAAAQTGETQP